MESHDIRGGRAHYDEAAYLADRTRGRALAGDPDGVLRGVRGVMAALEPVPYGGLLAEARAASADAVLSARAGDRDRAADALGLLAHLVEDMQRLDTAETATVFAGG